MTKMTKYDMDRHADAFVWFVVVSIIMLSIWVAVFSAVSAGLEHFQLATELEARRIAAKWAFISLPTILIVPVFFWGAMKGIVADLRKSRWATKWCPDCERSFLSHPQEHREWHHSRHREEHQNSEYQKESKYWYYFKGEPYYLSHGYCHICGGTGRILNKDLLLTLLLSGGVVVALTVLVVVQPFRFL